MENNDEAKDNILKKVSYKIRMRGIMIAIISVISCIFIVAIAYSMLFIKQTPYSAKSFNNVRIETKMETINQISDECLPYNHLIFTSDNTHMLMFDSNMNFYVENDDDNTSTLYFYFSKSYMQKISSQKDADKFKERVQKDGVEYNESHEANILLSTAICQTDNGKINEITKVYYLVYDYDNIDKEKFNEEKSKAVLLWEK